VSLPGGHCQEIGDVRQPQRHLAETDESVIDGTKRFSGRERRGRTACLQAVGSSVQASRGHASR
jgi:hypothetical protein